MQNKITITIEGPVTLEQVRTQIATWKADGATIEFSDPVLNTSRGPGSFITLTETHPDEVGGHDADNSAVQWMESLGESVHVEANCPWNRTINS
jgi:hypothetical protein